MPNKYYFHIINYLYFIKNINFKMMSNVTSFIINITFDSKDINLFNFVELETEQVQFLNNFKKYKLDYNEKDDRPIIGTPYISRIYFTIIDNLENDGKYRFKFTSYKNISYETIYKFYKSKKINIFFNPEFKSLNPIDCNISYVIKKTLVYEFCRIITWLKSQKELWSNCDFEKIFKSHFLQALNISDSDTLEDKIILLDYLINNHHDDNHLNNQFWEKLEDKIKLNSKEISLMKEDNLMNAIIEILIKKLKESCYKPFRNHLLFFILNILLLQEKYDKISNINLNYDEYLNEAFKKLLHFKEHYRINQNKFEQIQNKLDSNIDRKTFILLFSLIEKDEDLLLCLYQSWRVSSINRLKSLTNPKKINASDIIIYLKQKDLSLAEKLFEYIEKNIEETIGHQSHNRKIISSNYILMTSEPNDNISFSDIFYFDIDQTFIIFLENANESQYFEYLLIKALKYKNLKYFSNSQSLLKINKKIEKHILDSLENSNDCLSCLKSFFDNKKIFPEIVNDIFNFSKELNSRVETLLKKMSKFSYKDKFKLEEELKLYQKINIIGMLTNENYVKILKENENELHFKDFFELYNKDKIRSLFEINDNNNMILFLFEKIINTEKNILLNHKDSFIDFINNLFSSWNEVENNNINLNFLLKNNLFNRQYNKLDLKGFFEIYIGDNFFEKVYYSLGNILTDFLINKTNELKLNELTESLNLIYKHNSVLNKNLKLFVGKILDITGQYLPSKELFFRKGIDPKIELYYQIFYLIKKFQSAELNFIENKETIKNIEEKINPNINESNEKIIVNKYLNTAEDLKNKYSVKIQSFNYLFGEIFYSKYGLFDEFFKIIVELNFIIFNNEIAVSDYFILKNMENIEISRKLFLLGLFSENIDIYVKDLNDKISEVIANNDLIKKTKDFIQFYFKNLEMKNELLEIFTIKSSNINELNYNQLKELLKDSNELVNIYKKYSQYECIQFKKIFEFYERKDKFQNNFEDIKNYLQLSSQKIMEIIKFIMTVNNKSQMKEIIDIFLPLIDNRISENLNGLLNILKIDLNDYFTKIIQALNFYSKNFSFCGRAENLKNFIISYQIKESNFLNSLNLLYNNLNQFEDRSINEYILLNTTDNLDKFLENEKLSQLVIFLKDNLQPYEFLIDKEENDILNLIDFVDEVGDSFIKPETIKNCLKVLDFFKNLNNKIMNNYTDKEIIEYLSELLSNEKNKYFTACLDDVFKNINEIIQLYYKIANREEYSKIKIKEIHSYSSFQIVQEKNPNNLDLISFVCKVYYGLNQKTTSLDEIRDLRDRSLLLSKKKIFEELKSNEDIDYESIKKKDINSIFGNEEIEKEKKDIDLRFEFKNDLKAKNLDSILIKEEIEYLEICKVFSENVNSILIIYEDINYLYVSGYHINYNVEMKILEGHLIIYFNEMKFSSDLAIEFMEEKFNEIEESYDKIFYQYPLMTFYHGRQIITLYESLIYLDPKKDNTTSEENIKINEGLNLINNLFETDINVTKIKEIWFSPIKKLIESSFYEILEHVAKFIHVIQINFKKEIGRNINYEMNYKPGLYSTYLQKAEYEKEIIKIYKNFTRDYLPDYKHILICEDKISLLLIKSFIYRAFYNESNEPFILVNSDSLDNNVQLEIHCIISKLLNQFSSNNNPKYQLKSILIITYFNPELEFVHKIKKLKSIKKFEYDDLKEVEILKNIPTKNQIKIVNSNACGVGKSFFIKSIAKKSKLKYHYFPISGIIEKLELFNRLKHLNLSFDSLLHIDLNESNNDYIIRGFLFELLITNCINFNEFVFKINDGIIIYIEIPYGFIDFILKYNILECFEKITILIQEKGELDIEENSENIQIVANYLLNLNNNNIIKNNIYLGCVCENNNHKDLCPYYKSVPIKKLQKEEIYKILNEHLKLKDISFYQIKTFIDFLAFQFKKFSTNYYFGVSLLQNNQYAKGKDLLNSRKILVQSFIEITKYFTKSAYDNMINLQIVSKHFIHDNCQGYEKVIKNLLNENIISFNNIDFEMIFFNNDGQGISIIVKKDNKNYKKLHNLYNACSLRDQPLIDYEKLNNEEFLEQFQSILGKNNLVKKNDNKIISSFDTKGYIFTYDNFL